MKFASQINAYATLIGSKTKLSEAARAAACQTVNGKCWQIKLTLKDEDGNDLGVFMLDPFLSKNGNLTSRLTLKAEGELVKVDARKPTEKQVRDAGRADAYKSLEEDLLSEAKAE